MNGPFFNDRLICWVLLHDESIRCPCGDGSCIPSSADPTASPDDVRLTSCLHGRRAGNPPDSSPHRGRVAVCPASGCGPALPIDTFSWSMLPTWPIVATHSALILLISPEGSLTEAS